jgi:hypothetical protein
MLIVGTAVVETEIAEARFCCDLAVCKGGCCTIAGGRGAPVADAEVAEIEKAFPVVRPLLSDAALQVIARTGTVEGRPGDYVTPCVDDRECAYVYFDGGVAKCSFERAHLEGKIAFRKPISCHLFPIRVRSHGSDLLRYEQIEECEAARQRGEREDVPLPDFMRTALVRRFGEAWYDAFRSACTAATAASATDRC